MCWEDKVGEAGENVCAFCHIVIIIVRFLLLRHVPLDNYFMENSSVIIRQYEYIFYSCVHTYVTASILGSCVKRLLLPSSAAALQAAI